eukprot:XP_001707524.1 Hypothetical protein GL50803_37683 [Giardia lamblia ATCC 50803]
MRRNVCQSSLSSLGKLLYHCLLLLDHCPERSNKLIGGVLLVGVGPLGLAAIP